MSTRPNNDSPHSQSKTANPSRGLGSKHASVYLFDEEDDHRLRAARVTGEIFEGVPGPRFKRIGKRKIMYLRKDLDAWLDQFRTVANLAELETCNAGAIGRDLNKPEHVHDILERVVRNVEDQAGRAGSSANAREEK